MSTYTVLKIDNRYNGSHFAKYRIQLTTEGYKEIIDQWQTMRRWFWNTYGPSDECIYHRLFLRDGNDANPYWCWHHPGKFNQFYFMLAGDEELSLFKLKFS
jgi:hypothetical protein